MISRALRMVVCFVLIATGARSQEAVRCGLLFGEQNPSVVTLVNGVRVDLEAGDTLFLRSGRHLVERLSGGQFRWTIHRFIDTVTLADGEFVRVDRLAETEHLITSEPSGASVYRDGRKIGSTPFRFRHDDPSEGILTLGIQGFESKLVSPSREHEHIFLVRESDAGGETPDVVRSIQPPINNKTWTITSAATMVVSSVAAAYLKEEANRALDEYQRTGDRGALDRVRRYDRYSGIAAATMQVSFVGFAFFLTLE